MLAEDFRDIRAFLTGQGEVSRERWQSFYNYCRGTVIRLVWKYDAGGRLPAQEIEDLVQDVLAVATDRAAGLDQQRSFRNYVYGIAKNIVLYYCFRSGKKEAKPYGLPRAGSQDVQSLVETRPDYLPGEVMATLEDLDDVFQALQTMPPEDARGIYLRVVAGKSYREVAASLGISEDAAKKRVARAIIHIRRALLPYHPELRRLI